MGASGGQIRHPHFVSKNTINTNIFFLFELDLMDKICHQADEDAARRAADRQAGEHRRHQGELRGPRPPAGHQSPRDLALKHYAARQPL